MAAWAKQMPSGGDRHEQPDSQSSEGGSRQDMESAVSSSGVGAPIRAAEPSGLRKHCQEARTKDRIDGRTDINH